MKEFKAIVQAYKKVDFSQHQAAPATMVMVHGSSYRSPGARMLITKDGQWVGLSVVGVWSAMRYVRPAK